MIRADHTPIPRLTTTFAERLGTFDPDALVAEEIERRRQMSPEEMGQEIDAILTTPAMRRRS